MKWLAAAGAVSLANLFLHLPITDVLDAVVKRVGFVPYDNAMRLGFLALGAGALTAAFAWPHPRKSVLVWGTGALMAAAFGAQRVLLVASVENIHYPQYALLAWLIGRGGATCETAFLAATALGFADETYQYLALPRGTPPYLDWNDIVLNAMGAAFGVIALLAGTRGERQRLLVASRAMAAATALALLAAIIVSPPALIPFYSFTPGGRAFHRLSGFEAVLAVALLWVGVRLAVLRSVTRRFAAPIVSAESLREPG